METIDINERYAANVTQMRDGEAYGASNEQLRDGNMIPRLCSYAGENACAQACQLKQTGGEAVGMLCAEQNIVEALDQMYLQPENAILVSATKDRVVFGDQLVQAGAFEHPDGYTMLPEANGFYFRPGVDRLPSLNRLYTAMMRMADCGDVIVTGKSKNGEPFVGQGHFSRTNMRGPSAYKHVLNGRQVSWGEYFIAQGIEHYDADPASIRVTIAAAVEGQDFVHHYEDRQKMEAHFPGWDKLGFMHPEAGREKDFDCLIDYREMITWQLTAGIQDPKYRLSSEQIDVSQTINTGDLALGHASHHKASHGEIAHGRDLYAVGFNRETAIQNRIIDLGFMQQGYDWVLENYREISDEDRGKVTRQKLEANEEADRLRYTLQELQERKEAGAE